MIGKRKRNAVPVARQDQVSGGLSGAGDQARFPSEVFRKYFEAEFEPLPDPRRREKQTTALINSNVTVEDTDTDWSGLSDDESQLNVQVVEHSSLHRVVDTDGDKVELKSFMVSVPSLVVTVTLILSVDKQTSDTAAASSQIQNEN